MLRPQRSIRQLDTTPISMHSPAPRVARGSSHVKDLVFRYAPIEKARPTAPNWRRAVARDHVPFESSGGEWSSSCRADRAGTRTNAAGDGEPRRARSLVPAVGAHGTPPARSHHGWGRRICRWGRVIDPFGIARWIRVPRPWLGEPAAPCRSAGTARTASPSRTAPAAARTRHPDPHATLPTAPPPTHPPPAHPDCSPAAQAPRPPLRRPDRTPPPTPRRHPRRHQDRHHRHSDSTRPPRQHPTPHADPLNPGAIDTGLRRSA
jgi:hypothetical protein